MFVPQLDERLGARSHPRDPAVIGRRAVEKICEIHREHFVGRMADHVAERAIGEQDGSGPVNGQGELVEVGESLRFTRAWRTDSSSRVKVMAYGLLMVIHPLSFAPVLNADATRRGH